MDKNQIIREMTAEDVVLIPQVDKEVIRQDVVKLVAELRGTLGVDDEGRPGQGGGRTAWCYAGDAASGIG